MDIYKVYIGFVLFFGYEPDLDCKSRWANGVTSISQEASDMNRDGSDFFLPGQALSYIPPISENENDG